MTRTFLLSSSSLDHRNTANDNQGSRRRLSAVRICASRATASFGRFFFVSGLFLFIRFLLRGLESDRPNFDRVVGGNAQDLRQTIAKLGFRFTDPTTWFDRLRFEVAHGHTVDGIH